MADVETDTATVLAKARTHLANERTFAAWLRTGLSVAAAGIAVMRASTDGLAIARWLAVTFIVLGSGMIVFGGLRFDRVARDLSQAGAPVSLGRHVVQIVIAVLAVLVVCTFLVLV